MELTIKNSETGIEINVPKGRTANVDGEKVTIKQEENPIEWKPKEGETIWYISPFGEVNDMSVKSDEYKISCSDFRTKELAEAALELLKNAKHF